MHLLQSGLPGHSQLLVSRQHHDELPGLSQACPDCKVDYLATHGYWCDANIMMHYLEGLWNKFHKQYVNKLAVVCRVIGFYVHTLTVL